MGLLSERTVMADAGVVVIRTLTRAWFTVPLRGEAQTVGDVMRDIEVSRGIPVLCQLLVFEGRPLEMPGQLLSVAGVCNGGTVVLVVRALATESAGAGAGASSCTAAAESSSAAVAAVCGSRAQGGEMREVTILMSSRRIQVTFSTESTVADLKRTIEAVTGVPAASQRLIFAGTELPDKTVLGYARVEEGTVLHLVVSTAPPRAGLS